MEVLCVVTNTLKVVKNVEVGTDNSLIALLNVCRKINKVKYLCVQVLESETGLKDECIIEEV